LGLGFSIQLTKEAKDFIAERGFDIQFGARPLKRAIQKYLEDPMAEVIIKTDLQPGDVIDVDLDKEKDEIVMRVVPQTKELAEDKDSEKKKSK
jgi:ATP-dependent Clp protease ATP-binding subunit ClpC